MKTFKLFSKVKWLVVTCLMLLTISPQVWGTDFTFRQIKDATTTGNIAVSTTFSVGKQNSCKPSSSQLKDSCLSIANSAGKNWNSHYVEIRATTGTLASVTIKARQNATSGTNKNVFVYWSDAAASGTFSSLEEIQLPYYTVTDCDETTTLTVPSGTKVVRMYRYIKVKDGAFSDASGYSEKGTSSQTWYLMGVSATLAGGGGCTSITPTWSTDYSSTTLNVGATSSTPAVGKDGSSGDLSFISSDDDIATVNSSGVVTGVATGSVTITATVAANGGKCEGTVTKSFTIKAGVTYNSNSATGGTVPTDASTYAAGASVTTKTNSGSLYKTGYVFNGWNTKSDGTGTHYEPGASLSMPTKSTGLVLYAEWVGYATSWEWWNSGQSNDGTTFTYITSKNYICSFASSGSTAVASWDMSGGVYYRGIKIKTKDHYMYFWVQTGKRVSITFGTRPTKPTFTVGGVDKSSEVGASENADSITVTYTTTGDTKFYIENETATKTAFTVKSVKIEDDASPLSTTNPSSASYVKGASATALSVTASGGTTPYSYQWYSCDDAVKTNPSTVGTNSASYTPGTTSTGYYYCTVTDAASSSVSSSVATITVRNAYAPTASPAAGTVASGTAITLSSSDGGTIYYTTNGDTPDDKSTEYDSEAKPTITTATTIKAVAKVNDYLGSVLTAAYTIDDTAPTLSSSNPDNGDTDVDVSGTIVLTFSENISSVDASKFTLTGATKGDVAIDGSDATKVNIAYSDADNEATVTLSTAAAAVTDAVGNTSAALSDISFTTVAETSYTVTYDANGGSSAPSDDTGTDITLNNGSGMTAPSGYTFAGWNTNATGTGTGYAGGTTGINTDLELYAIWKPTTACADGYSHVYSYYDSRRLVNGKRYNAIETTTWGSILAGTSLPYTSISGLTSVVLTKGCQAEDKIDAGYPWINSYIKVDKKSSTDGAGITITVASGYIGKLKIRAGGYSGNVSIWNNGTQVVAATSGNATSQNAFSEQTIDLVTGANLIQFDGNNAYVSHIDVKLTQLYTLTLDKNNSDASGSSAGSAYVEPNGTSFISGFTAPTRTGYDVEGYYGEAGCTTKIATAAGALQASKSVSEVEYTNSSSQWTKGSGATLYAKWTPAVYTVTLDADGGTINSGNVTEYTYGVGATLPNDVTAPSGSVFLGWYDGSTKVTAISNTATGNKSYKAKYGRTLYDSYFYQLYSKTSASASAIITNAGFPSYITTNISNRVDGGTPANESSITTPHDFSGTPFQAWYLKYGSSNTITISAVADVKAVHFYGWSTSSRNISTTATLVSGTGSDLSISNVSVPSSSPTQIKEYIVYISTTDGSSARSGYSNTNYYDYVFSSSGEWFLWGIYVEKYTNVPVTGVSLNKSSTTLTAGDTEQLTATIAPANATNKAVTWTSSNTNAATVSSTGLITAKAEGETTITVTTSDGSYTATCIVTVEAFSCAKYAGKIFELEVIATATRNYTTGNGTEAQFNVADVTVTDGTAYAATEAASSSGRGHIYYTSSVGYIELKSSSGNWAAKLNLTKCTLRNGDVISFTQKAGDSYQISITTSATRATTNSSTSGSYTVTPGDGLAGASTIYVWHASSNMHLKTLTITRPTSYVMTYNPNGGRDEVEAERLAAGANTLTTDVPTRAGYVFKEWNTQVDGEGTGLAPGASYTMPASASELFAKWVEPVCGINVIASVTRVTDSKTDVTAIGCTGLMTTLNNSYQIQSSGYFGLTLPSNFQVGDIVTFNFDKGGTNKVEIFRDNTGTNILHTQNSSLSSKNNSVEITITQDMVTAGLTNTITMYRTSGNSQNHIPNWVNVKRYTCPGCMSPKSGVTTWSTTASDWIGPNGVAEAVPDEDDVVYLDRAVTVGTDVTAHAKDVILGTSGTLTISSQGTMIAEHTIRKSGDVATGTSDLIIDCDKDHQGALIFENPSGDKQAQGTVNFYTRSYRDNTSKKLQWQYVGYPFASGTDEDYGGYYINKYSESQGKWIVMRDQDDRTIRAWEGLAISGDDEGGAQLQGTFAPTTNTNVSLTYGNAAGENLIGNSWTAPIQLENLAVSDFNGAEATIYIFNTGRYNDVDGKADAGTSGHTAGQWLAIPIEGANWSEWAGMKVIPAFQAFEVITSSATTLSLDYSKVVRSATNTMNAELHAPARRGVKAAEVDGYRIRVADSLTQTDMYLFEDITFTTDFDNGWEGYYMACDGRSAQLYAQTALGKMAVAALPDLEGTLLGFKPGKSSEYTFSFGTNAGVYYLNDIKTQTSTLIQEGYEYTFTWEDGDNTNRFIISATPFAKTTPTGVDKVQGDKVQSDKVRKVLIDDHLYIIRAGKVFDATGAMVK